MRKKKIIWAAAIVLGVLLIALVAGIIYINDVYDADTRARESLVSKDGIQISKEEYGYFFDGSGTEKAIVFYPGAKVDYTSYAPLMKQLAGQGVDCFLVKMPLNLAILGKDKAADIMKEYSYEKWYIAGHSLGGAMAAAYVAESNQWSGLVLLAAYPTEQLPEQNFKVLSIYGTNDEVVNTDKLIKGREFYPSNSREVSIEGGNHAFFGDYGEQRGDGTASISREEQQKQTVNAIVDWLK